MSKLTTETINLLDKVYNLRGSDSAILVQMDEEMDNYANSYDETNNIRQELEENINKLNNDVETLSEQGERLKSIFNNVEEKDYEKLLETLKIDFHPDEIKDKLNSLLPITINGLVSDIRMSSNELSRVEDKLQELRTKSEELSIRKEEALVNQDRLNHYFDLALNSEINTTREELTSLFYQLNLDEEEARECAKLLMFPEDGLFEYEKEYKNAPRAVKEKVKEELKEDKKEENESFVIEPIEFEEEPITFIDSEDVQKDDEILKSETEEIENKDDYIEKVTSEDNDFVVENIDVETPVIEEEHFTEPLVEEIITEPVIEEGSEPIESLTKPTKDEVIDFLTSQGFDSLDFTTNDIEKLMDNFDKELINENINTIKSLGINLDVFADNIELFYDKEMKSKIDKLTEVGKLPQDIYLNPNVLTKYNLLELDSAIKVLEDSGLEPKNVPLMAY